MSTARDSACEKHDLPGLACQGFSKGRCKDCSLSIVWPDTNTPVRCKGCAEYLKKCMWCDEPNTDDRFVK